MRRPRFLRGRRIRPPYHAQGIVTQRLVLRRWDIYDASSWFAIQSDPAVQEYMDWPVRDEYASKRHLRDRTKHIQLEQDGDFLALAVQLRGSLIMGDVSCHLRVSPNGHIGLELGWILCQSWWGHGFATEAVKGLLENLLERIPGVEWVGARISYDNTRSQHLAKRLGLSAVADFEYDQMWWARVEDLQPLG